MEEEKEEKNDNKILNIIKKILFSIIIIIIGFFVCAGSYATAAFIFGSPPSESFTIITRFQYISAIALYISCPVSFFILLLLNVNIGYEINLLNYIKCLFFPFIIIISCFYLENNKNQVKKIKTKLKK